ncbi:hypothetical protein [Chloroflexus sp.]|uniref:hypothetical protein n=1 Tax=Chloroflexus sp. TaxID=1904827 RepID=UPI002ACD3264|nr:hypothetical protein [Chloroflexus sp.]
MSQCFQFCLFLGSQLPQKMALFAVVSKFVLHEIRDRCRVHLTSAEMGSPVITTVLLDIDYFLAQSNGTKIAEALDWVETAHNEIETVLEGCITDQLRSVFDEDK